MKKIVLIFTLLFFTLSFSQEIKLKKDKILSDKKEILSFEKGGTFGAINYDIYELNSKKHIIALVDRNGGTHMELSDDYIQVKFITLGSSAEISGGDIKNIIKLLIKSEVLKADGTLDEKKIDLFIKNYDEKITERTIITK